MITNNITDNGFGPRDPSQNSNPVSNRYVDKLTKNSVNSIPTTPKTPIQQQNYVPPQRVSETITTFNYLFQNGVVYFSNDLSQQQIPRQNPNQSPPAVGQDLSNYQNPNRNDPFFERNKLFNNQQYTNQ